MFFDISTLKDETTVQCSRLKLFQLASQILLPIRATSISLYLNWRRGYLETTALSMLFDPPTLGSQDPFPPHNSKYFSPATPASRLRYFAMGFGRRTLYGLLIHSVLLHTPSVTHLSIS